ncbi:hypothetical protein THAOC_10838, partial [Thalassiosira oceanica]
AASNVVLPTATYPSNAGDWPLPYMTEHHRTTMLEECSSDADNDHGLPSLPTVLADLDIDKASMGDLRGYLADIDWGLRNTKVANRLELHIRRMNTCRQIISLMDDDGGGTTMTERNLLMESANYILLRDSEHINKCRESTDFAGMFWDCLLTLKCRAMLKPLTNIEQARDRAVGRHEKERVQGSQHHCLEQLRRANFSKASVDHAETVFAQESSSNDPPFRKLIKEFLQLIDKSESMNNEEFVREVDNLVDRACDCFVGVNIVPNFGYRIREGIKCLVIKHWAPDKTPNAMGQKGNTCSTSNACLRQFAKSVPGSLHRSTTGEMSASLKEQVHDAIAFVDMCICQLPKDRPMERYSEIASMLGVTVEDFDLFCQLNITAHAIAHKKRTEQPLPLLVSSAGSAERFVSDEPVETSLVNYCGRCLHGEVLSNRVYLRGHTSASLRLYTSRLVAFYSHLHEFIGVSSESQILLDWTDRSTMSEADIKAYAEVMSQLGAIWAKKYNAIRNKRAADVTEEELEYYFLIYHARGAWARKYNELRLKELEGTTPLTDKERAYVKNIYQGRSAWARKYNELRFKMFEGEDLTEEEQDKMKKYYEICSSGGIASRDSQIHKNLDKTAGKALRLTCKACSKKQRPCVIYRESTVFENHCARVSCPTCSGVGTRPGQRRRQKGYMQTGWLTEEVQMVHKDGKWIPPESPQADKSTVKTLSILDRIEGNWKGKKITDQDRSFLNALEPSLGGLPAESGKEAVLEGLESGLKTALGASELKTATVRTGVPLHSQKGQKPTDFVSPKTGASYEEAVDETQNNMQLILKVLFLFDCFKPANGAEKLTSEERDEIVDQILRIYTPLLGAGASEISGGKKRKTSTGSGDKSSSNAVDKIAPKTKKHMAAKKSTTAKKAVAAEMSVAANMSEGPTGADVICGRGGKANTHEGNKMFRDEARRLKDWYESSSKSEKYAVSAFLVDFVKRNGGRFLARSAGGEWDEVDPDDARKKASQALREGRKAGR